MCPIPFTQFVPVSPSDSESGDLDAFKTNKRMTSGLYIGGTGDVACVDQSGTATVFAGVPAGTTLPVSVRRVNLSGTSASFIVACYWI